MSGSNSLKVIKGLMDGVPTLLSNGNLKRTHVWALVFAEKKFKGLWTVLSRVHPAFVP